MLVYIRATLLALFLVLQIMPLIAQEEEEEPLPPPRPKSAAKIGGGGGFTPVFLFWNVDALNEFIPSNAQKFDKNPIALFGGQGYAYIMLLENLRVGGLGVGGSVKTSALERNTNIRRDIEVAINFGGVTVEYVIPIMERLDIVPGILLGGGGMEITTTRNTQRSTFGWDELWNEIEFNSAVPNLTRSIEGSFFVYQPSLQIEYALLQWLGLRVGVSYVGMISPTWKLDEQFDVAGVPNKINGNGFVIHTGIFLGTFLY
jgi:hypothetical protein